MEDKKRPQILENAPLHYEPVNEMGVVFLFSHLLKKWRLKVDCIRSNFPDCIAYQKTGTGEKPIRIEFEYKSRNFQIHRHDASKCDWIVCWEDNWPNKPKHLQVIELRREFGLGFNVWIQPIGDRYKDAVSKMTQGSEWSASENAHENDLTLAYFNSPESYIKDIFVFTRPIELRKKNGLNTTRDYIGSVKRVCTLKAPIYLKDFQNHHIIKTSSFVRARMQGRQRVTEYWPYIYDLITQRNHSLKKILNKYSPDILV